LFRDQLQRQLLLTLPENIMLRFWDMYAAIPGMYTRGKIV